MSENTASRALSPSRDELLAAHRYAVQAVRDIIRHHPAAREPGYATDVAWFSESTRSDLLDAIQYSSNYIALVLSDPPEAQHAERQQLFEKIGRSLTSDAPIYLRDDWLTYTGKEWKSVRDSFGRDVDPTKVLDFKLLPQSELREACVWFLKELRACVEELERRESEARDIKTRRLVEARAADARDRIEDLFAEGSSPPSRRSITTTILIAYRLDRMSEAAQPWELPPSEDESHIDLHTNWPPPSPPPPDTPAHSRVRMLAEHRYAYQAIRDILAQHPEAPEAPDAAWFSKCERLDLLEAIQAASGWLMRNISQQREPIRQRDFERIHESVHNNMAWEWNINAQKWKGSRNVEWTVVRDSVVTNENQAKALNFFELPQQELCGVCAWMLPEVRSVMNENAARVKEREEYYTGLLAKAAQAKAARAARVKTDAGRCCLIL